MIQRDLGDGTYASYDDEWAPLATMDDAHREWHRNTGVPMGQPGCPQDACHPPEEYDHADETGDELVPDDEYEIVTDEMLVNWREANEYTDEAPEPEDDGMPF